MLNAMLGCNPSVPLGSGVLWRGGPGHSGNLSRECWLADRRPADLQTCFAETARMRPAPGLSSRGGNGRLLNRFVSLDMACSFGHGLLLGLNNSDDLRRGLQ